jgi:hypothetical protein
MWSLTSPRAKRTSGARNFHPPTEKDFFNSIDPAATLAMHCGNVFDVGSSPYQNASLSR